MTIKITKAMAVKAVRQAVKAKGRDHTAECAYMNTDGTQPSCIVGHALINLGVRPTVLGVIEGATIKGLSTPTTLADMGVVITPRALDFLDKAQEEQDNGQPWGAALKTALEES